MTTVSSPASDRTSAERKFYARMGWLMAAIIVAGFAPSFYLRGLVHYPRPNPSLPPHVMLHGLMFTGWLLIYIAQTQLISANRRDLHMKLGVVSFAFAVTLIPLMYLTSVWEVARANQPPFTDALNWTIVPLAGIIPFGIMLWIGWTRRREAQFHKHAMLCAALMIMQPGIGRIPLGPPMLAVHAVSCVLSVLIFLPLVLWDRKSIGQVHPVTMRAIGLVTLVMFTQLFFLATGTWAPIAAHLPGVGA